MHQPCYLNFLVLFFFRYYLLIGNAQPHHSTLFSWQSSWNAGEDYASSFFFDPKTQSYSITGALSSLSQSKSSESSCVVAKIKRQSSKLVFKTEYSSNHLTSCSSITQYNPSHSMIVTGFMEHSHEIAEQNGTFSVIDSSVEENNNVMNSFFMNLHQETGVGINGKIQTDNPIQYPQSVINDINNKAIIVASSITADAGLNVGYEYNEELPTGRISHPNPTLGLKYGSNFQVLLQQFQYVAETNSFRNGWIKVFATQDGKDARVHDAAIYKNRVVFVGSTAGHGAAFGGLAEWGGRTNLDGFVTQIRAKDGSGDIQAEMSVRVFTETGDDVVNSVCVRDDALYVVGSTNGHMLEDHENYNRFSAFLRKLDGVSLQEIWTKEIKTIKSDTFAPQDVLGMSCVVSNESVYVSGIVNNGGNIIMEALGYGQDDIFVAKFSSDGEEIWRKQIGTNMNDVVPKGHQSMSLDEEGNVIVIGSTRGSLYRQKGTDMDDYTSDIFIATLDQLDGTYPPLVPPLMSTKDLASPSSSTNTASSSSQEDITPSAVFGITFLSLFLIALFSTAAYIYGAHRTKVKYLRTQEDDTAEVQRYLEELEKEEEHQKKATVTATLKHMFISKRASSGRDALNLEHGPVPSAFGLPNEIRLDNDTEKSSASPPAANNPFTISDLGVVDDFMGAGSISSNNDIEEIPDNEANGSAYNELLDGLNSISGLTSDSEVGVVEDAISHDEELDMQKKDSEII